MVRETVGHGHRRDIDAGQRIPDFKIVLAASHLSDVSPGRSRIGAQRIIHPFTNFMGHYRGVSSRRTENPACFKVYWRVGLHWEAKRPVVAENTAFLEKAGRTHRHHHIVEEKNRKCGGVDSLGSELRDDGAGHKRVPPVDVDYAGEATSTEESMVIKGCAPARGHIDGDCGENRYVQQSVVISPNHFCEVCSLKCIKVLRIAHIVSVESETCGANNWRPKGQTNCRASRSCRARVMNCGIEYAAVGHDENNWDDLG